MPANINATLEVVPGSDRMICFYKFHYAKQFGDAVDKVRRQENRELTSEGIKDLMGTNYHWLMNLTNMTQLKRNAFKWLRESSHGTAWNRMGVGHQGACNIALALCEQDLGKKTWDIFGVALHP